MIQVQSVTELKSRHAELEIQLLDEDQRPQPDPIIVSEIKREKLKIKDLLAAMGR